MSLDYPMTALDACALLALKVYKETLPVITRRLDISENALLDMIENKAPLTRRVMRDLGLEREISYRKAR